MTNQRAGTDIKRAFLMEQGKKGLYAGMLVTLLIVGTAKLVLLALVFSQSKTDLIVQPRNSVVISYKIYPKVSFLEFNRSHQLITGFQHTALLAPGSISRSGLSH